MISESRHIARSKPVSPWWNTGLKMVISIALIYLIYRQILQKENLSSFIHSIRTQLITANPLWVVFTVALVPLNFTLENWKWRSLLASTKPASFMTTMKAILCGSTLSIVTPNRLGEYGGRILYTDADDNWKAIYATAVGNLAQLIVLVSLGWIGAIIFFNGQLEIPTLLTTGSVFIGLVGLGLLCLLYFNIDLTINLINRLPFINKVKQKIRGWKAFQHLEILRSYGSHTLAKALGFGLLKYIVYTTQYVLLLYFFGIEVPLEYALAGVATIYLIQTSIPLPAFIGLVARGELALLMWSYFSDSSANILGATFSLWILNLLIPALIGLLLIYKVNIVKSLGYD